MPSEPAIVIGKLANVLDSLGIPYMVGGSVASAMYGVPDLTNDVYLSARLDSSTDVNALVRSLEDEFFVDGDLIRGAIRHHSSFNILYLAYMLKADIFVPEDTEWREQEWLRRQQRALGTEGDGPLVYLASPEDIVLQKLLWYRMTGERSDRQWGDVQGVLKVQNTGLDFAYLREWAAKLEIDDLLAKALQDAGLDGQAGA